MRYGTARLLQESYTTQNFSPDNMIKCIIFDLGGVVIDYTDDKSYYPYLSKISGFSVRAVRSIIEGPLWSQIDKDQILLDDFERSVARRLKIEKQEVKWYDNYAENARINEKVIGIVRKLCKNYLLAYLSNVDRSRYSDTSMKLLKPYLNLFKWRLASCEFRLRKPTRAIYKYALRRMRLKPEEAIFIDNRLDNVVGARKAGIRSILFTTPSDLEKRLKKLNIRL